MNQVECLALRDMLFANRFSTEHKQRVFRYLAVEPGGVGDAVATVHYAYVPAVWERAGCFADADRYLRELIAQTPYNGTPLALQQHDYLRQGWPLGWGRTAKDSFNDFPTLVLRETADGQVWGALMRDPHDAGDGTVAIAAAYAEPEEVDQLLRQLEGLEHHTKFMGLYNEGPLRAESLADAIAQAPATEAGQKAVLLYRGMEWWHGLWTQGDDAPLSLSSMADFYGIRSSGAKRQTRKGLDIARNQQTIPGDYAVLEQALDLLPADELILDDDYEALPAIQVLCQWWNEHAPESMRLAGVFRLYFWDDAERLFQAGDPEEPAVSATELSNDPCYALFERQGRPSVAASFFRGRSFNQKGPWGTNVYSANGDLGSKIGADPSEVNEAYYSFIGLRHLRSCP